MGIDLSALSPEEKEALLKQLLGDDSVKKVEEEPEGGAIQPRGLVPVNQLKRRKPRFIGDEIVVSDDEKLRKEDEEYWRGRQPIERRPASNKISVRCRSCGSQHSVYFHQAQKDPELGWIYYCNNCSRR